ncbi:MAG: hypothetical protein JWO05_3801 [Gemmatimonadetes bacterium]|nr:hypothetical protein [Gemmatimonadota bacterium]
MSVPLPGQQPSKRLTPLRLVSVASEEVRVRERLRSLDVFRGMTVAAMLLVNDPGNDHAVYAQLRHAHWNGWTVADLVFPFFLFVVGITTHLSLSARAELGDEGAVRRQVLRRGLLIFAIGFLINWQPFYQFGTIAGHPDPTFLDRVIERMREVRFLGVLQRIGLAYMGGALLGWHASAKRLLATAAALLLGYWIAMSVIPIPGPEHADHRGDTLAGWVDRGVLDWSRWGMGNHIWAGSVSFDPEGILSTIPAIATVLLGMLAGRWLVQRERPLGERLNGMFAVGAIAIAVGLVWGAAFPINKNIWSSSFVLFTAGFASITLATIMWLVDERRVRAWSKPFVVFGTNPLLAFVGSELMAVLLYSSIKVRLHGELVSAHVLIHDYAFASWLPARMASLGFAIWFVLVWYGILLVLYRKRIILKV